MGARASGKSEIYWQKVFILYTLIKMYPGGTMKKILFLAMLAALPVWAQDTFKGEDFDNQSEITVQGADGISRCQAVRIAPRWYLTAAHCVVSQCDNQSCDIIVDMLQGDLYASAIVHHNELTHKRVYVHPDYRDGKIKSVPSDIALILFDPKKTDYFFRLNSANKELSWSEFKKLLKHPLYSEQRDRWAALEEGHTKLYVVSNALDRRVLKPIAVPDLKTDTQLVGEGFYYFDKLKHYIGPNMDVDKGMSGSGVVVPGGGIIGIVSTVAGQGASAPAGKQTAAEKKKAGQYFLFTPINHDNENFLRAHLNYVEKQYIVPMDPKIAEITEERLENVFGDFAAAEQAGAIADKK